MKLQELMHKLHEDYLKYGDVDVVFNWTAQLYVEQQKILKINGSSVEPQQYSPTTSQVLVTHYSPSVSGIVVNENLNTMTLSFYSYS